LAASIRAESLALSRLIIPIRKLLRTVLPWTPNK
jgi:hypothetical protein